MWRPVITKAVSCVVLAVAVGRAGGLSASTKRWTSACSTAHVDAPLAALDEAAALFEIERDEATPVDFCVVYVGAPFEQSFIEIADAAASRLGAATQVCVLGAGVVGGGREEEFMPCVSIMGGSFPEETNCSTFVLGSRTAEAPPGASYWGTLLPLFGELSRTPTSFFVFADPFSAVAEAVAFIDESCPGAVVVGGLSCPQSSVASLALHTGGESTSVPVGSVVGVALRGPRFEMHSITAQGAVGVGPVMKVTASPQGNVIAELDDVPAVEKLHEVAQRATEADPRVAGLLQVGGVLVGVASPTNPGDFLVRGLAGATRDGALVIGDTAVRKGARIRFYLRDADAARADISSALERYTLERSFFSPETATTTTATTTTLGKEPFAAVLTACNARGKNLFGEPNYDSAQLRAALGDQLPIAGFFANGEIGPIGARVPAPGAKIPTYLHGFTSVVALLYDKTDTSVDQQEAATIIEP